jgi:hypothetical protein
MKSNIARDPSFIEPMQALAAEKLPEGDWLYEVKLDGYRELAFKAENFLLAPEFTKADPLSSIPESASGLEALSWANVNTAPSNTYFCHPDPLAPVPNNSGFSGSVIPQSPTILCLLPVGGQSQVLKPIIIANPITVID